MHSTRESALAFVAGKEVDEIVALCEEIYDEVMADRIWSGTRALAQLHLDAGQRVWLVTATPVELATIIADRLGLTGALGTVAEIGDGVYTGRLVGDVLHGDGEGGRRSAIWPSARASTWTAARPTPTRSTTCRCSRMVGRAVAVNPDSALRAEARDRGWEIRDFRTGRKAARIGVPAALGARRGGRRRGRRASRSAARATPGAAAPPTPAASAGSAPHGPALHEQPVQRSLDGLAHLVGEVEHDHRVVGGVAAELGRRIGSPNSMNHFDGSGISPSGPSHGNVGVTGKYGRPSSRASGLTLPSTG